MYSFLRTFKGFKKVENYIQKVWAIEQQYRHPTEDAVWKPTSEEREQYEIDRERLAEVQDCYKSVERVLDERQEIREGMTVNLYFCKWTSESTSSLDSAQTLTGRSPVY